MGVAFIDPIKDYSLKNLIAERDSWEKKLATESTSDHVETHRKKVVASYNAEIERRSRMSNLGQLLAVSFAAALDETKKCHVYVRKDNATVSIRSNDPNEQTMPKHLVEQYVQDHGFNPNGEWVIEHYGLGRSS